MYAKEVRPVRALRIRSVASSENDGRAKAQQIKKNEQRMFGAGAPVLPASMHRARKVTKHEMRYHHGLKWNNQQRDWVPVKTGKKAPKKE
jgi:hypothetical protein